jgi:serine/threonine-protein kinase HipA
VPPEPVVDVFSSGHRAGTLRRSDVDADTVLFGYSENCGAEDAVSLTMPIVSDQYDSMGTVHPIFEMNMPEGLLLETLRMMFAKTVPQLDDLTLLAIVGQSQIGRLRYAGLGAQPGEIPRQSIEEILTWSDAHDLFNDLLHRYASYSGVSGMQPKVLVSAERITARGATHIVKSFDPRERPELAANEYYCLRAAHHAGIPAANAALSDNRRILVVERFDLKPDGSYLGMEDFCVLNGIRSHGRYEGSYELLAKRVGQFVSPENRRASLRQLFLILALSCAVENGDAHLKNFAVIYEHAESSVRLSPAYDVVSTTPYQPRDVLALTLDEKKSFPDREKLIAFGRRACELTPSDIAECLDRVASGVDRAIAELREAAKRQPDFAKAANHFIGTFERGLQRLRTPEKKRGPGDPRPGPRRQR